MSDIITKKLHFEPSTIETIDKSMMNFIEGLSLATSTNKGFKKVPVIWGTAERTFQAKNKKEVRDSQGLLVLPLISIKRSSFTKPKASPGVFQGNIPPFDDEQGSSLATERVIYQEKTLKFANADAKRLNAQTNYPRNNAKVVYRTVSVPMPVNVEVNYEIVIRTEYQQQMNELMVPFVTKPGTINFIRLSEGEHRYEGFIQEGYDSSDNLSDFTNDERKFETKIQIRVIGYIMGEGKNREKPHYAIRENAVEVKLPRERISLAEVPEHEFGSYYGLSGIRMPVDVLKRFDTMPFRFSNVPAVGYKQSQAGTGTGAVSNNVVTTENFANVLSENMSINELLKASGVAVPGDRVFTTAKNLKANSERIFINGIIQTPGASPAGSYVTSGNNITFHEGMIEIGDEVVIIYIISS